MAIETDFAKELENLRKTCLELEEKTQKNEMKCLVLENEVENLKKKNLELEAKIVAVQKDSEDLVEVMTENKVLKCDKQKVKTELCYWKEKQESNIKGMNVDSKGTKEAFHGHVRKRLSFEEDGCINKNMSPSTSCVAQSPFIDIRSAKRRRLVKTVSSDDEDSYDDNASISTLKRQHSSRVRTNSNKKVEDSSSEDEEDDEDSYDDNAPISTLKRQHSSRVRTNSNKKVEDSSSEDEEDDEDNDNAPISTLKRQHSSRVRIRTNSNKKVEDSPSEDEKGNDNDGVDGAENQDDWLSEFINDIASVSKCDSESSDSTKEPDDALSEYKRTMKNLGRKKVPRFKWKLEGEMLFAFAEDPELRMRAVCALYRKQTADEKASKLTIHRNGRGFSQPDAPRASKLAEFLTDGDPEGDLKKTVEELKAYNPEGLKLCELLADKYSTQLFNIFLNKEDPYFKPQ